jgi:hypothetical protein
LIWMNTIQLFILHQLMKSQWKMKMSSKKSSWCCAIYYYSLTQTSILRNGNCANGYRALKVSSNLEKFPFLKCASGNRALNFLRNFWDLSKSFLETVRVGTFLVFSRKFPRKCASGYVPPAIEVYVWYSQIQNVNSIKKPTELMNIFGQYSLLCHSAMRRFIPLNSSQFRCELWVHYMWFHIDATE